MSASRWCQSQIEAFHIDLEPFKNMIKTLHPRYLNKCFGRSLSVVDGREGPSGVKSQELSHTELWEALEQQEGASCEMGFFDALAKTIAQPFDNGVGIDTEPRQGSADTSAQIPLKTTQRWKNIGKSLKWQA